MASDITRIILLSFLFNFGYSLKPNCQQEVNFAQHIAPIIYNKCTLCHRPGEIGPMPLTNYQEVKDVGRTLKYVTKTKYMPPYMADPSYSTLLNENILTDEQIGLISRWVDNGMPRGNSKSEPSPPVFPKLSALGKPDLVLEMSEYFTHKGNNKDNYQFFVLPTGLTKDKKVKAIEFRPGNTKILHHAVIIEDVSGVAARMDSETEEYGFDGEGGFFALANEGVPQRIYGGYLPGQSTFYFPEGTAQTLSANSDMVIQVHYAPYAKEEKDKSHVNIFFADEDEVIEREVKEQLILPSPDLIGKPFIMPADEITEFHGVWNIEKDISLLSLIPHMHLIGKHWEIFLERPSGEIVPLLRINDWDFNWQGSYFFTKYIPAFAGDRLHAIASYDNTASNPNNPHNPPQKMKWGLGTSNEMYYLLYYYVDYNEGDENIKLGSNLSEIMDSATPSKITSVDIVYNDLSNSLFFECRDHVSGEYELSITDLKGNKLQLNRNITLVAGTNEIPLMIESVKSNIYMVALTNKDNNFFKKIAIKK